MARDPRRQTDILLTMNVRLAVIALLTAAIGRSQISFQPPTSSPTQGGPVALVTADFNGDGKADLAISETGSHALAIWLGNGDGTFQQSASYPVATTCQLTSLSAADFTGDHKPDVLGICQFSNQVLVFPSHGDGTFGTAVSTELPEIAFAGTLFLDAIAGTIGGTVGDFNRDGRLDLVVLLISSLPPSISSFPPPTSAFLLPGKGDGTFGTPIPVPRANGAIVMTSGDFNGDGKLDLAFLTVDTGGEDVNGISIVNQTLIIALGNGDGTFQGGPINQWNGPTFALSAADVNGDGFVDLYGAGTSVLASVANGTIASNVTVWLGDGKGNFKQAFTASDPSSNLANSYCLADLSGKGQLDLLENFAVFPSNFANTDVSLGVRQGDGKGGFGTVQAFAGSRGIYSFSSVCADFNGDGLPDVAFSGMPFEQVVGVFSGALNLAGLGAALGQLPAGQLYVSLNGGPGSIRTFGITNAASFASGPLAANSIASAFWDGPTNVNGVGVTVKDSAGQTHAAQIFFSSSTQINYWIPDGTALGQATVTITGTPNSFSAPLKIVSVAPGIFNVSGLALGYADTVDASGKQTYTNVSAPDTSGAFHLAPIDVSGGNVFLLLFGTGIRNHAAAVTATIGSTTLPTAYAGAQGAFVGEDQINIALPASLAGSGAVHVSLSMDGQTSNSVQIQIK